MPNTPAEYRQDDDVILMARVANGDLNAFENLIEKYQKPVINTAYRYTGNPSVAEDLAQDVFVRVFRAASTYRPDARFATWLFTIVRNVCANYRSREGRLDRLMDFEADLAWSDKQENPEERMIRIELENKIQTAINQLPESLRMPFVLNQYSQLQYSEVAEVLDMTLSAVKVRIHRAKSLLAQRLIELKPLR